jgi:hypothetical protein
MFETKQRHILEHHNLSIYRQQNLKSHRKELPAVMRSVRSKWPSFLPWESNMSHEPARGSGVPKAGQKVAGSKPDEVNDFLSLYLIFYGRIRPWGLLSH